MNIIYEYSNLASISHDFTHIMLIWLQSDNNIVHEQRVLVIHTYTYTHSSQVCCFIFSMIFVFHPSKVCEI